MEQKIFTELRPLYATSKKNPNTMRIRIRMRDLIEQNALRNAVDTTMKRYPYFCVELQKKEGQYIFAENHRPIVISNSIQGVELNSEESNFHMIAFCRYNNVIILDIFHGLTDGAGAYEIVRTLLYYYCSLRYNVELAKDGIKLNGDKISAEEWVDPVYNSENLPAPKRLDMPKPFDPLENAKLRDDNVNTVFSVALSEAEFIQFNKNNGGSPGTMVSLFLSRAIVKLYPDAADPVRVILCVNQRKALHAPLAHQSLVGGAYLEFKKEMHTWPLSEQAKAYRNMVSDQAQEEAVLAGVHSQKGIYQMLLSMETEQERISLAEQVGNMTSRIITASVSYVGKANYGDAEKYIRDFHLWTAPPAYNAILIEISAVNGRFILDIIQPFSSPIFVNAFLRELEDNNINYDLQDVSDLYLPNIRLPWTT